MKHTYILLILIVVLLIPVLFFVPDQVRYRKNWDKKAKKHMYALALKGIFNETEVTDLEKEYAILSNPVITKDSKGNIIAVTRDMESITIFSDIWSNLTWVRFEIFNNKYATTDQIISVLQQCLKKNSRICTMKLIDDHGHEYYISE